MPSLQSDSGPLSARDKGAPGPQINEHRAFQNLFWTMQRVAWVGIAGLLLAACLGFAGDHGVFARQTVVQGGVSVDVPAYVRQNKEYVLTVIVDFKEPSAVLHFDRDFYNAFTLISLSPPSSQAYATSVGTAYVVDLSGAGPKKINVAVEPHNPGRARYRVTVRDYSADFATLILP